MRLSEWESGLLSVLGWKVRAVTATQLSQGISRPSIRRRLRQLANKGLIETADVSVANFSFGEPLVRWPSANWKTDLARTPSLLSFRWRSLACKREQVVWISKRGIELNGGFGGSLRQRLQLQHDLGTTHVFFTKAKSEQDRWVGEDWLRCRHDFPALGKLPDAVVVDEQNRLCQVIEFGGQYSKSDLWRLHETCVGLEVPYEIW